MSELRHGRGGWIATANLDHLRMLRKCEKFRDAYAQATVVVADGMPLIWASRLRGTPLPERVAGSDLIYSLTQAAAREGRRCFLLGGNPGTAEGAAAGLAEQAPGLNIVGTYCPPMGFDKDPEAMAELRRQLVESGADVLFVALGAPKQELLIRTMRSALPNAWWIGVGISFSFVCGDVRRAPRWMQRVGLEWLHRMASEPKRLSSRYLVHGLPFAIRLLTRSTLQRFARSR